MKLRQSRSWLIGAGLALVIAVVAIWQPWRPLTAESTPLTYGVVSNDKREHLYVGLEAVRSMPGRNTGFLHLQAPAARSKDDSHPVELSRVQPEGWIAHLQCGLAAQVRQDSVRPAPDWVEVILVYDGDKSDREPGCQI